MALHFLFVVASRMFFCGGNMWLVVVILFLYAGHSVHVAVAEVHACHKIVLPCPFRYFRFPHPRSYMYLLEKCSQVCIADAFVDSVFIIVYNHGLS